MCHGVFDLLHIGHILHFEEAKKKGDVLIVSITGDKFVNKGPNRPMFTDLHRAKFISNLSIVDFVFINHEVTSENVIDKVKPNFYFKGPDYKKNNQDLTGQILKEKKILRKNKGKIIYSKGQTFSSSKIINDNLSMVFNEQQSNFLRKIRQKYSYSKVQRAFHGLEKLKVLIIGETIIDRYVFCETIGKSGKEPMLVLNENSVKDFLGGAAAICNQVL